jgi:hypothetical protein
LLHGAGLVGDDLCDRFAGGSVKDRAALYLIKDAEERGTCLVRGFGAIWLMAWPCTTSAGLIRPGGTIVEGTAGNVSGLSHRIPSDLVLRMLFHVLT